MTDDGKLIVKQTCEKYGLTEKEVDDMCELNVDEDLES
jgi:hypothetical protein